MFKASWYGWNIKGTDDIFRKLIISETWEAVLNNEEDNIIMCVGKKGTGKSSLMFHAYEAFDEENCSVDYITFDKVSLGNAIKLIRKNHNKLKFLGHDEANISKRDALTKYNKRLLDMIFKMRKKRVFQWWNNPSLNMIDKAFIEDDAIKGVIYINTKRRDKPRTYYYFTKKGINKLLEKHGNLKLTTIDKYKKKYALYKGWFNAYTGKLWNEYSDKKDYRIDDELDRFAEDFGDNDKFPYKPNKMMKLLKISEATLRKYFNKLKEEKVLIEDVDYYISSAKTKYYNDNAIQKIKAELEKVHGKNT